MAGYRNKAFEEIAVELCAGLVRLRRGYVDAAEALLELVEPDQDYPYDFVLFRLTGFRSDRAAKQGITFTGRSLRSDLLRLILDVSGSFPLHTRDYNEPVYRIEGLARRFNVATRTVQRWRKQELVARRLVFPDGRRRIGFLDSSVRRFSAAQAGRIARSARFRQLDEHERDDILRRARRMAQLTDCSLTEVSRRLARRTGRAVETIRYTIRRHDREHPHDMMFGYLTAPLAQQEKLVIYRCFLRGVPVAALARRYGRTRGSVYRVINEMRAGQILQRPIDYIFSEEFERPDADELILNSDGEQASVAEELTPPADASRLPPYISALYEVPLLDRQRESELFRRYNYLKYKADQVRRRIDPNRIRSSSLKRAEALLLEANAVKNLIIRSNLRLVVSIAKKHVGGPQELFELISDGNVSLMRAAEKFDYTRGHRFSTYASWAIMRNFARSVPKERTQQTRFASVHDEILEAAGMQAQDGEDVVNLPELRETIDSVLSQLTQRERMILVDHYGLDGSGQGRTLDQLGRRLGVSKERVRQIEAGALRKLRRILHPQQKDLLT
jgi:RNA polymerase sigma factor (sigma-70 family)